MTASSLLSTDEVPSRKRVAQHLHDPALSIDAIAQSLRCKMRLVHNAVAGDDGLTGHILRRGA